MKFLEAPPGREDLTPRMSGLEQPEVSHLGPETQKGLEDAHRPLCLPPPAQRQITRQE